MRRYTIKIPAGQAVDLGVVGNYVRLKVAAVNVLVESPDNGEEAELEAGDALNLSRFDRLRLSHADSAEQAVTLLIGNGTSDVSAKFGGVVSVSNFPPPHPPAVALAQSFVVITTASAQILPANPARRFLLLQNKGTSAVYLNLAGGVADANGVKVMPGDTFILDVLVPSGEISAVSDALNMLIVVEG